MITATLRAYKPLIQSKLPIGARVSLSAEGDNCLKPSAELRGRVDGYSDGVGKRGCLVRVLDLRTKRREEYHPDFLARVE